MLDNLRFTFRVMLRRPLRTLLTILQVGLGVWIVTIILSINFQANDRFDEWLTSYGEDLASIRISIIEEFEYGRSESIMSEFRLDDIELIKESSANVKSAFIFEQVYSADIIHGGIRYQLGGLGATTESFADAMNLQVLEGSFFTTTDVIDKNKVILISEVIKEQLFPDSSPIGQTLAVSTWSTDEFSDYEIIGVYKQVDPIMNMLLMESHVLIPLESHNPYHGSYYSEIYIKSLPGRVTDAVGDVRNLFAYRAQNDATVNPTYMSENITWMKESIRLVSLFLGGFAFIAIVISSIGILSIMLVSVVERTREIGIRRALGASTLSIIGQVINESIILSLIGAGLGILAAAVLEKYMIQDLIVSIFYMEILDGLGGLHPFAVLISLLLTVCVGALFGLYPAIRAAQMSPVDALKEGKI